MPQSVVSSVHFCDDITGFLYPQSDNLVSDT